MTADLCASAESYLWAIEGDISRKWLPIVWAGIVCCRVIQIPVVVAGCRNHCNSLAHSV